LRFAPLLSVLLLALSVQALAEPKDDARRHFRAGLSAAADGDFDIALQRFLAAQEAFPHPATLYNIAQTYLDLDDPRNALTYFRQYRDQEAEKQAQIDPMIQVLEARIGAPATVDEITTAEGGDNTLSDEERARLEGIARELEALSIALKDRGGSDSQARATSNAATNAGVAAGIQIEGIEIAESIPDVPDIQLEGQSDVGLVTDAYERIVVTASRYGQDPLDSPSTISMISAEDIRLSGATTIPELLRRVVGLDVMQLSGGHADISIRGFNRELNNKVLVLIDGRSTYWDFVGATIWTALPISLEEIDRIEIIRGPGSAIYGANAVTGVINIITRLPGEGDAALFHADAGTVAFGRGTAMTSGRVGPNSYRFAAGYQQHGRWSRDFNITEKSPLEPFYEDQTLGQQVLRANGRVDRTFGTKGFASVSAGYSKGRMEYYSLGSLGNFGMDIAHNYVRGDIAWGNLHIRSFWNAENITTAQWVLPRDTIRGNLTPVDSDVVDVEIENPFEFETGSIHHKLNVGLGYRNKHIRLEYLEGGFDRPYSENHYSVFVNEELAVGKVRTVASLRADRHPLIPLGQTISPRVAFIYRIAEATSLRATGGTAFRAPNMVESYTDFVLATPAEGAYITVPGLRNPVPERIATVEAGIHDESTDYHVADLVFYVNQISQQINLPSVTIEDHLYNPDTNGFNVGYTGFFNTDATYNGFGTELDTRFFPADGLDVFANLNIAAIPVPKGVETPNFGMPGLAKINLGSMYRAPFQTDFSLQAHYVADQVWPTNDFDDAGVLILSPQTVPARFMMSGRVGVRPIPDDEKLEVAVTAWNMLAGADGFQEHPKGQFLRSRIFGSFIYSF